ncbi:MAG: hypothetical protein ACRDRS_20610 [Pseudonocardiaceae bacterium]
MPLTVRAVLEIGTGTGYNAALNDGRHRVTETGPTRLWAHVENAHRHWAERGQPGWDRLGLTVDTTTRTQMTWLDQPEHPIATLSR